MANTLAPFGFQPYSNMSGAAPNYQQVPRLANYNAAAIFQGDAVRSRTDGTIEVAVAAQSTVAYGVFVGCEYLSVSQKRQVWSNYWPGSDVASTNFVTCYCINDAGALFLCQSGTAAGPVTLAQVGENASFLTTTPGNTANGISGMALDQATTSPSTTFTFRIVSLVADPPGAPGTDTTSAYNFVIVGFNNVESRTTTSI